ncbi:MAG: hypothetical protein IK083_00410 [Abditibacteriota bacterium]|nr:hypothetical protein [Abditibacteriota bacterium]
MKNIYYASDYAVLDSHVEKGGGTDDTAALQSILDKARDGRTPVRLVMDGAALITGLVIWPNTTIECINPSCGFFLADGSNRALLRNGDPDFYGERRDKNITISGGTWNHNARGQEHHIELPGDPYEEHLKRNHFSYLVTECKHIFAFEFYGVENVTMRDMTVMNQRTYVMLMANFRFVTIENVNVVLRDYMSANNQDGFHFWGPGQFLTLRNLTGTAGDDFIALAPDEADGKSSITDVMIDGVHLNDSDQGIRLLSRGEGVLDRVLIKNVTGTYRGLGFIINPWFPGPGGRVRNVVFDTVELRCIEPAYDYIDPFLFKLGGNIENLTLRHIHFHADVPAWLIDAGGHYMRRMPSDEENPTLIDNLSLENVYIHGDPFTHDYVRIRDRVNTLTVRNALITGGADRKGAFITGAEKGSVGSLIIDGFTAEGMETLCSDDLAEGADEVTESRVNVRS